MNKILMTGLGFLVSKLIQGVTSYQGASEELTKLRLEKVYVHAVKIARLFCISLLVSGACLVLLLIGLSLIHHIILFYAPWAASVKVTITLICAIFYILIAAGMFAFVFAEDKWMKMFNTDKL
jgi:polyferredoxin